jgi:hypothetical protein
MNLAIAAGIFLVGTSVLTWLAMTYYRVMSAPADEDVPSKIDLRTATDAREWIVAADVKRPW